MKRKRNLALVAAARPNFMKIAPLTRELKKHREAFSYMLVHTGQHYNYNLSKTFFDQLKIPAPDINLEVGSGTHAEQTATVMIKFEQVLMKNKIDLVVVVGDVNSTMACTLAAAKTGTSVAHVEAGLRSFDRKMPEEINRLVTDSISDILYTPSADASEQLRKEGVNKDKIFLAGNIMIDTLLAQKSHAAKTHYYKKLNLKAQDYVLLTLHRPSNVDDIDMFRKILIALMEIARTSTIIFPVHPRTRNLINDHQLSNYFNTGSIVKNKINLIEPLGYNEMLNLTMNARAVITDSGGLQEETTALAVPCITLRENTERWITVEKGSNTLAGTDPDKIIRIYASILDGKQKESTVPPYWDGFTAKRIMAHLSNHFG